MNSKRLLCLASLLGMTLAILGFSLAQAQPVAPSADIIIQPTVQIEIPPAQLRTWKDMEATAAQKAAGPPPPPQVIPFRPDMGSTAYQELKARVAQAPAAPKIGSAPTQTQAVLTNPINFEGVNQYTAGLIPPDTHGTVGPNHFLEITNAHVDVYQKTAPNALVKSVTLAAFFGYNTRTLFDPQAIYDPVGQRWILCAEALQESATVQYFYFAISQTSDPLGVFWVYRINVSDDLNGFWDFPKLGMDQNAILFTANFFPAAGGVNAKAYAAAKSSVYSGFAVSVFGWTGLLPTLVPPFVLDSNPTSYFAAANTSPNVAIYRMTGSGSGAPVLFAPVNINVGAYAPPPNAAQPGTTQVLDTSDRRFVNASTQIGNSLFQVHTIATGSWAIPRWYEFNTVANTVIQSGYFYRSATSYDFNASIRANKRKDVFVTWSSTDPPVGINAEVRYAARLHSDPLGVIPSPGYLLFGSASNLTGNFDPNHGSQRWGDYSAVSLDPADASGSTAWIVNERIVDTTHWGSRIGQIKLPHSSSGAGIDLLLLQ